MTPANRMKTAAGLIELAMQRAYNDFCHTEPGTPERERQARTMEMFRDALDLLTLSEEGDQP